MHAVIEYEFCIHGFYHQASFVRGIQILLLIERLVDSAILSSTEVEEESCFWLVVIKVLYHEAHISIAINTAKCTC